MSPESELQDLAGFIANPNPQVRFLAIESLAALSLEKPALFKKDSLTPIKHCKFLVRDDPKIAEHALTILINLSGDTEVLEFIATDDKFLGIILANVVDPSEPNANLISMLLANLAKHNSLQSLLTRTQPAPAKLGSDPLVLNQLMDLFVKGADGTYNPSANYDYLAYLFADLAKHPPIRQFLVGGPQPYDSVVPLNKIKVFTEHPSTVRRKGVASAIKNAAFDVPSHAAFLDDDAVNILPYLLLPIVGGEPYDDDDMLDMLPDLQLLPPDKKRDPDATIVQTHVETLTLLATTREGRDLMRQVKVYPVIRETHARVDDENVQEACERLVQILMRDEADDGPGRIADEEDDEDEDQMIVPM
ncbi:hypothetical protein B0T18DRAFT_348337 [Schizothecium vesticola]|uniref:Protein HGH1 homolog n=1 Tax=Schizothecium vesticola TaxID=314040 RepID=A0AA40EW68_9PEZI|nr:hypothetical protein B0T18DRAFT_348337 [Schizothecium vesticola]